MPPTMVYGTAAKHLTSDVSWTTGNIRCALLRGFYVFSVDHEFFSSVVEHEFTSATLTGYTAGGASVSGRSVAYNPDLDQTEFHSTGMQWTGLTTTGDLVGWGVVYALGAGAGSSPLIQALQLDAQAQLTASDITLRWADEVAFSVRPG